MYCYECDKNLDPNHPQVVAMTDSILLAQSAYEADKVGEWEQEIKPCECTMLLDQSNVKKIEEKGLAHCEDCDLKSNLWLNLQSGHLGCGRKNYDGTGGNNHAIEHFKATGNGLCVKMGTITPEGKASIHCYKCDDEVHDPNLAEHLKNIGIDIGQQIKTEKTIGEQELELNLNLTLSKVIEDGKTLIPVFGPGNTGL